MYANARLAVLAAMARGAQPAHRERIGVVGVVGLDVRRSASGTRLRHEPTTLDHHIRVGARIRTPLRLGCERSVYRPAGSHLCGVARTAPALVWPSFSLLAMATCERRRIVERFGRSHRVEAGRVPPAAIRRSPRRVPREPSSGLEYRSRDRPGLRECHRASRSLESVTPDARNEILYELSRHQTERNPTASCGARPRRVS